MIDILTAVLFLNGALIIVVASIGMLRFPDLFTRMHAASKSASLGVVLLAIATAIKEDQLFNILQILLIVFFVFLKSPIAAQALARAAYRSDEPAYKAEETRKSPLE